MAIGGLFVRFNSFYTKVTNFGASNRIPSERAINYSGSLKSDIPKVFIVDTNQLLISLPAVQFIHLIIRNMNKVIEDYILQEKIGSGQYGNVYKAEHKHIQGLFAVKVMNVDKFKQTPKLTEFTNNQIAVLGSITHLNIIKFIEMFRTSNNYYLTYQFCNGGTLAEIIKKQGKIPENQALRILQQLQMGFEILYEHNILHRDIKPTNILFNDGVVKLADFGFCKKLLKQNDMTQTMVGSPIYMAPEVLKGLPYDSRADIWSLGVILYEMIYGVCPFEESTIPKLINMIDKDIIKFPNQPQISPDTKQLIQRILTIKINERMSPQEFIKFDLNKIIRETAPLITISLNYLQVGKFVRRALIYLSQTLEYLTSEIEDVFYLRIAFLVYKIINNILKDTAIGGAYWERLDIANNDEKWESVNKQEVALLKPYGQIVRQSLIKEDTGLKTKVQLQNPHIDSKFFLESMKKIEGKDIKLKLFNCFLYNKHFNLVMEKRVPDWADPVSDGLNFKEKEEICYKYARYY